VAALLVHRVPGAALRGGEYFQAATPETEYVRMNIGTRPSKRIGIPV
jgi:hypothetical protein